MSLEDIHIEKWMRSQDLLKSHKYIRREWRNGRWRYWYEEIVGRVSKGQFGKVLTEYVGKPAEAFKRLFKDKRGQAYDVVTVNLPAIDFDDNGEMYEVIQTDGKPLNIPTPIDLVWGDNKKGLFHILLRHFVQQNDFHSIKDAEADISVALKRFETNSEEFSVKFDKERNNFSVVDNNGIKMVIGIEQNKDDQGKDTVRHFILTSFDISTKKALNNRQTMEENYEKLKQREY